MPNTLGGEEVHWPAYEAIWGWRLRQVPQCTEFGTHTCWVPGHARLVVSDRGGVMGFGRQERGIQRVTEVFAQQFSLWDASLVLRTPSREGERKGGSG